MTNPIQSVQDPNTFSLSITPPTQSLSIDEHSSISEEISVENDRSMEEEDVPLPQSFSLNRDTSPVEPISQENMPSSMDDVMDTSGRQCANEILSDILINLKGSPAIIDNNSRSGGTYNLASLGRKIDNVEDLIVAKDNVINALSSELESFKDLKSNSNSFGTSSSTEYRQLHEDCYKKMAGFRDALQYKDSLIERLTDSLEQSVKKHDDLIIQSATFKTTVDQLEKQLKQTEELITNHVCHTVPLKNDEILKDSQCQVNFDEFHSTDQLHYDQNELNIEVENLKTQLKTDQEAHENEIKRLTTVTDNLIDDLKEQMTSKHTKEMEELRTYFEQKCADLEKNYSEEVFSQHSRKLSDSSSYDNSDKDDLDVDLTDLGGGGDGTTTNIIINNYHNDSTTPNTVLLLEQFRTNIANLQHFCDEQSATDKKQLFDMLQTEIKQTEFLTTIFDNIHSTKHSEAMEMIRNDYYTKLVGLNKEFNEKETELNDKIDNLKEQIVQQSYCSNQEVANSGDYEVVKSYEIRLQEQINVEKLNLMDQLETKVQELANIDSTKMYQNWPSDLLRIREKFEEIFHTKIEQYEMDLNNLKVLQFRNETNLTNECTQLKQQNDTLRCLVEKLIKYFDQCEAELNNTLIEKLSHKNNSKFNQEIDTTTNNTSPLQSIENLKVDNEEKRFHLKPKITTDLYNVENLNDSNLGVIDTNLLECLEKLKVDANFLLSLSSQNMSCLQKYNDCKKYASTLELEKNQLEVEYDNLIVKQKILEDELHQAQQRITTICGNSEALILHNNETICKTNQSTKENRFSSNFLLCENDAWKSDGFVMEFTETVEKLNDLLQERSRSVKEISRNVTDPNLVRTIEDLGQIAEKIAEESKKEVHDLKLQIESADNKYRLTCRFLEEQTNDREQERDEAQKEINWFKDQLRDRDKDRETCQQLRLEIEKLEQQVRDVDTSKNHLKVQLNEVDVERREAIEKIYDLREIIRSLEGQLETRIKNEEYLRAIIRDLECLIQQYTNSTSDSTNNNNGNSTDVGHLRKYIGTLEAERDELRLKNGFVVTNDVLGQYRNCLQEFESNLDRRIKELEEFAAASTTCCSSPSEDMSVRDVINQSAHQNGGGTLDECEVPLQQLARLKDKLVRHSRAEDVALKRIRDTEMQLFTVKSDLEKSQVEKSTLKKQIADQLVLISSLQIRLEEQRIRSEFVEKQTNNSLEVRIYDLQNEIYDLEEKLRQKDKLVHHLNVTLDELKTRLKQQPTTTTYSENDAQLLIGMQKEIDVLRQKNQQLEEKLDHNRILPNLVDNIISDKNSDIGMLREQLSISQKQLEVYSGLKLDRIELEAVSRLQQMGVSFNDLLSIDDDVRKRHLSSQQISDIPPLQGSTNYHQKLRNYYCNDTCFEEISAIEKPHDNTLNFTHETTSPLSKRNSTEIPKKRVTFVEDELRSELERKSSECNDLQKKLIQYNDLQAKFDMLQTKLTETDVLLKKTTQDFQIDLEHLQSVEKNARLELISKKVELNELEAKYSRTLEELKQLRAYKENHVDFESVEKDLKTTIGSLKEELSTRKLALKDREVQLRNLHESITMKNEQLKSKEDDVQNLKSQLRQLQEDLIVAQEKNHRKMGELEALTRHCDELTQDTAKLRCAIKEKDKVIAQMSDDSRMLHVNLQTIQQKLHSTGNVLDLGKRLKDEQKKTFDLLEEIHDLKAQLFNCELNVKCVDELTTLVSDELNQSRQLDQSLIVRSSQIDDLKQRLQMANDSVEHLNALLSNERQLTADLQNRLQPSVNDTKQLEIELERLRNDNSALSKSNLDIDTKYRYTKDLLTVKIDELKQCRVQIDDLKVSLVKQSQELAKIRDELTDRDRQLDNARCLIDETEHDRGVVVQQMNELSRKLDVLQNSTVVPNVENDGLSVSAIAHKVSEINGVIRETKNMVDLVTRLTYDKHELEKRIVQLQLQNEHHLLTDSNCAANLLARYLRSDSYRKALIWQKRYLVHRLGTLTYHNYSPSARSGRKRFRKIAWTVISVLRMQFLVVRWHSGKRFCQPHQNCAESVVKPIGLLESLPPPAHSRVLVESYYSNSQCSSSSDHQSDDVSELPWSGNTPPIKEEKKPRILRKPEELTSPSLLSKYLDRFNRIQDGLGLQNT